MADKIDLSTIQWDDEPTQSSSGIDASAIQWDDEPSASATSAIDPNAIQWDDQEPAQEETPWYNRFLPGTAPGEDTQPEESSWSDILAAKGANFVDTIKSAFYGTKRMMAERGVSGEELAKQYGGDTEEAKAVRAELGLAEPTDWTEKGAAEQRSLRKTIEERNKDLAVNDASLKYFVGAGIESSGLTVTALAASLLFKNPSAGMAVMGMGVAGEEYGTARDEGRTINEATMDAAFAAASEAIPERIPLGILTKEGGSLLARIGKAAGAEGLQEVFTSILQKGYDLGVVEDDMTWEEARKQLTSPEFMRELRDSAVIGAGMGGTLATVSHPFANVPAEGDNVPPPAPGAEPGIEPPVAPGAPPAAGPGVFQDIPLYEPQPGDSVRVAGLGDAEFVGPSINAEGVVNPNMAQVRTPTGEIRDVGLDLLAPVEAAPIDSFSDQLKQQSAQRQAEIDAIMPSDDVFQSPNVSEMFGDVGSASENITNLAAEGLQQTEMAAQELEFGAQQAQLDAERQGSERTLIARSLAGDLGVDEQTAIDLLDEADQGGTEGNLRYTTSEERDYSKPPVFRTRLDDLVSQRMGDKPQNPRALREQIAAWQRKGEIKPEEMQYIPVDKFLNEAAAAGRQVTKQEVLQFIDQSAPKLKEVKRAGLGVEGANKGEAVVQAWVDQQVKKYDLEWDDEENAYVAYDPNGEVLRSQYGDVIKFPSMDTEQLVDYFNDESYTRTVDDLRGDLELGMPQAEFEGWKPIKGGENYRELTISDTGEYAYDYQSKHWPEKNVLSHARFDERTTTNGEPTLLVQEIQSDLHQEGRKYGYKGPNKTYNLMMRAGDGQWSFMNSYNNQADAEEQRAMFAEHVKDAEFKVDEFVDEGTAIPEEAPFKKSWPLMTFKRMLAEAVDLGKTRIAWPTGAQAADTYDLRQFVNTIKTKRIPGEKEQYQVRLTDKYGEPIAPAGVPQNMTPDQLENTFGKNIADQITGGEDNMVLSGNDLTIGGKGMVGFYDQILPAEVNKYLKKAGVKVEKVTIDSADGPVEVWSAEINDAVRDMVEAGQAMFTAVGEGQQFDIKTNKDGSVEVRGDIDAIREQLPERIIGRKLPAGDGLLFSRNQAPRVVAALEKRGGGYSRAGQVLKKKPMKDGKYVGAPERFNTPAKIAKLRKELRKLTLEGERGRFWYENSSRSVLEFVGGDVTEARKFVALLSIYSPQAKVDANGTFALRAWAQYKAGLPIQVKTKVQDEKAQAALSDVDAFWSGEKTGNFFQNLLAEIDPTTKGKQGATIDMWMMRAGQYDHDAPNASEYAFMEDETNRIASELGWDPHQVQAAIWVAMKARMENPQVKKNTEASSFKKGWIDYKDRDARKGRIVKDQDKHFANWIKHAMAHTPTAKDTAGAKFDFQDALMRNLGQLSWEPVISKDLPYMKGLHKADYQQQLGYYSDLVDALYKGGVDGLAQKLGLMVQTGFSGPGVWEGSVTPSHQKSVVVAPAKAGLLWTNEEGVSLTKDEWEAAGKPAEYVKHKAMDPAQKKLLDMYGAVIGLVLRQDSVGYHRTFEGVSRPQSNTVQIDIGRPFTKEEAKALEAAAPTGSAMIATSGGIRVINFTDLTNKEFHKAVESAVESIESIEEAGIAYGFSDANLIENNWRDNPNGENYIKTLVDGGRSDLVGYARSVLAPRVAEVNQRYAKDFGWGDPGPQAVFTAVEAGQDDGRGAGVQVPSYGEPQPGAVRVQGVHYSREPRGTLDSSRYGTGIRGAEKARLDLPSADPAVRNRIFFYIDEGAGIRPEGGVGANAHTVDLANVYDLAADPNGYNQKAREAYPNDKDSQLNEAERLVVEAGFDGIYVPGALNQMGVAVLLGNHKVTPMQGRPVQPTVAERQVTPREQTADRLAASTLPSGRMRASAWLGKIAGTEFDTDANRAALEARGDEILYRSDLADVFTTGEAFTATQAPEAAPTTLREQVNERGRKTPREVKRLDEEGRQALLQSVIAASPAIPKTTTLAKLTAAQRAVLRYMENILGRQIMVVDTGKYVFDGVVLRADSNTIIIASNHKAPLLGVLGHEFIHTLRSIDKQAFARLGAALVRANGLTDADVIAYREQANKAREHLGVKLSFDSALEELLADMSGTMWNDTEFLNRLAETDPSVFEAVVKALKLLIDRVLSGIKSTQPKMLGEAYIRDLEKTRDVLAEFYSNMTKTEGEYDRIVDQVGNVRFTLAHHGGVADFQFFDENMVGTGESNQAYGWGLYFGEERGVGQFYRDYLSKRSGRDGVLYAVDLKFDADSLLDWDGGMRVQPAKVQAAIRSLGNKALQYEVFDRDGSPLGRYSNRSDAIRRKPPGGKIAETSNFRTGGHLYRHIERILMEPTKAAAEILEAMGIDPVTDERAAWPADRLASAYLHHLGVQGVQFLDQKSRVLGAGSVTRNFVAFKDSDIEIISKEGGTPLMPKDLEAVLDLDLNLDEVTMDDGASLADAGVAFTAVAAEEPKKTIKAYKMFRAKDGQLFPLFIDANVPTPVGKWVPAEIGDNEKSKIGKLALRPGWHAGDSPTAKHIGGKLAGEKKPTFRKPDQVWAEVEIPADRDWQAEAERRAKRNKAGDIIPRTAEIKGEIPAGGHYRYKTNPNMEGEWIIGGALKVNRLLTDAEVEALNKKAGTSDLPRQAPVDWEKLGFDENNLSFTVAPETWDAPNYEGNLGYDVAGAPNVVKVDGRDVTYHGFKTAQDAAAKYVRELGIPYNPPKRYAKVDTARAARIAEAYEAMPHAPQDPKVKAAYEALAKEVKGQYQALLDTGLRVEFMPEGRDPYGNPRNVIADVVNNNHMYVYPTVEGFGTQEAFDPEGNPLLAESGYEISGRPALLNDLFRVVHDYFGHIKDGFGFRASGEENAWRSHSAMFTDLARRALTTETRGQNSWLNYGPHGETNRTATTEDTVFADQKTGLLPEWVSEEGAADAGASFSVVPEDKEDSTVRFATGKPTIGHTPTFEAPTKLSWFERFRIAVQNKYLSLIKIQNAIGADNILEEQDARLYQINYPGRVRAKIEEFEDTYYRQVQEFMRRGKHDLDVVGRYLHARHAKEANAVLKKRNPNKANNDALSGMTDAEADAILKQYAGDPELVLIGRVVDAMNREKVRMLEDAGVLSAGEAQAWRYDYAHYVPLYREEVDHDGQPGSGGSGFQQRGKVSKLRAGSEKPVDHKNLLAFALAGVESAIVRVEKNVSARSLYELAKAHPHDDLWQVDELPTTPVLGADGTVRHQPNVNGPGVVALKINGEPHYVVMNMANPVAASLYSAWTNQEAGTGPLGQMLLDPALKLMRYWSAINTSLSPEFMISNFFRDFQTAAYNLSDTELNDAKIKTLKRVFPALAGIRRVLRGDQKGEWAAWYIRMEKAGGTTGWMQSYENIERRSKEIERGIGAARKLGWAWKGFKLIGDFIGDYNTIIENGVRLASFRTAVEMGLTERQAARVAKELTVNFNEKGNAGTLLNSMYLFYNASVQGSVRTLRAMKSKTARRLVYATVLVAATNHILNALGDDEDDDYNLLDPKLRDRSFVIRKWWSDDGGLMMIPLPWGYNVFHILGQEIGDAVLSGMGEKKDYRVTKSLHRVAVGTLEAFNPVNDGSLILTLSPTILDPAVKVLTNTEWHGGKLYPDWNEYQADYLKYFRSAREPSVKMSKWLAESTMSSDMTPLIDVSPETFDMVWDTFTGSMGRFYADTALTTKDIVTGEIAERETREIPLLRKVYREIGDSDVQRMFYDQYHDFKKSYQMYRENKDNPEFMREAGTKLKRAWNAFSEMEKEKRKASKRLNTAIEKGNARLEEAARNRQMQVMRKWLDDHTRIMYED